MRGEGEQATGRGRPQRYEIRVGGRLGDLTRSAFPGLQAKTRDGDTVLSGVLADKAALYGVLAQIEALGLELIEVHRLHRPDNDATDRAPGR